MAIMINKKVSLVTSYYFDHADLIGSHYFSIYGKTKKRFLKPLHPFREKKT